MPYANNYPNVAPLASGMNDNAPAAGVVQGAPLDTHDMADAEHQYESRKRLHQVDPTFATVDEVAATKIRKIQIEAEHAAPVGIAALNNSIVTLTTAINDPNTGLAALAASINDANTGLAALAASINDANTGLAAISHKFDSEMSRNINRSSVRSMVDATVPVPNAQGIAPPRWFQNINAGDLQALPANPNDGEGLDSILTFYQQPVHGNRLEKIVAVKSLLGITI